MPVSRRAAAGLVCEMEFEKLGDSDKSNFGENFYALINWRLSVVMRKSTGRTPQKVSRYQESSLNRIKTDSSATFLINFDCKMNARMLWLCIKYSMCDLICDVIACCVWSCDMNKINVYDKIMIENQQIRNNTEIKAILYKFPSNKWFSNGIHSLLSRADARGSADIIYRMWRISLFCRSSIVTGWRQKVGHAENI